LTQENTAMKNTEVKDLQWSGDLVRKFWNYQSRFPEIYFTNLYGDRIANAVLSHVPPMARILDYACGTGSLTGHLLRAGFSVGACDLSPDSVEYVQKNYSGHPAFCGASTIDDLLARGDQFDVVVLVELIEHVDSIVLSKVMANLRKILAPGGMVIMTTPNDENLDTERVYCPSCNHTFHRWQHLSSWNRITLTAYLAAHGFKALHTNETDFSVSRKNSFIRHYLQRIFLAMTRRKQPHLMVVAKLALETSGPV